MKGLEWLKEEMDSMHRKRDLDRNPDEWFISKTALLKAIDQLDKPEVLSPEWLEENEQSIDYRSTVTGQFVESNKLRNIIVPKQEKVKIESVWAEDIESAKARGMTLFKTMNWMAIDSDEKEKQDLFARAWLDGYTVEEEQKYFAKIKGHENIVSDDKYWNYCITDESLDIGDNKVHTDVLAEYMLSATKDEWEYLGINDDNSDFVRVEELEK